MRQLFTLLMLTVCSTSLGHAQNTTAADDQNSAVHYSYSTLLGTGYYTAGDQSVAVIRLPLGYTVREPAGPGKKPGIKVKIPVTGGFHNFDEIPELEKESLLTWTIMPGVEANYQLSAQWEVDAAAYVGHGRNSTNDRASFLWASQVRSRYDFNSVPTGMTFGSEILYSGYAPDNASGDSIVRLAAGLDFRFPTNTVLLGGNVFIAPHLIGYYYPDTLSFKSFDRQSIETSGEIEFGLSVGRNPRYRLMGYEFDRVGIAYRFSDDTKAILLITQFPF